ncbi:MAG: sigma 54-interacting transcriptional regulator [Myxococcales bacterium]|nr:MAG: sigma 54-interacting transcriptional regulator [Myxococcales bacterium]
MAASNRSLANLVREGAFREDLFYRLNVVTLEIPALRERKSDIPLIVDRFISEHRNDKGIDGIQVESKAMDKLLNYDSPGNVRQLQNAVLTALVLGDSSVLKADDFDLRGPGQPSEGHDSGKAQMLSPEASENEFRQSEKDKNSSSSKRLRLESGRCRARSGHAATHVL